MDYRPLKELKARIDGVIERKGPIEILQFSGGEPTLHPQFFELLEWAQAHRGIDFVLVNTNGVLLARDVEFRRRYAERAEAGGLQLYLQFDGVEEAGQQALRGVDLRALKAEALDACEQIGATVTLAMTVIPGNLDQVWATVEYGLARSNVRGVSFQPMFGSGRVVGGEEGRLNTADIVINAVERSGGVLKYEDFTPLPCGDPNCATIGYLMKLGGQVRSISDFVDFGRVQGFLKDKIRYELADLAECGCESEPLGDLLKGLELDESNTFRLFIKPFMDAHSWDDDRIDRCCTHVIRPDGKLDSFCRYYSGFSDTQVAP